MFRVRPHETRFEIWANLDFITIKKALVTVVQNCARVSGKIHPVGGVFAKVIVYPDLMRS
jgi:hypothetical protein